MTSLRRNRPPMAIPTAAELDILSVLWTLGTATVREVHDELGNDNRYTTTLKTMQLMTEKRLLIRSADRTPPGTAMVPPPPSSPHMPSPWITAPPECPFGPIRNVSDLWHPPA